MTPRPSLDEIALARERLRGRARVTPVIDWLPGVRLKLEHLQVGGSFKFRGALNRILTAPADELRHGVITASGGNHGLGVAHAARECGLLSTIFLPKSAPLSTEKRLIDLGARVERHGRAWDDAWARAVEEAQATRALLVHPFEDFEVIAGQGTIGLELLEQVPDLDAVVIAIGGGGLIAGVAHALKAMRPSVRVFGVEPSGATSMKDSLAAGRVVALDEVRTIAGTLAPRAVGPRTLALCQAHVEHIALVDDDELRAAMRRLWSELRILVEPAGAAAVAALASSRLPLDGLRSIVVLVCGANLDPELAAAALA